MTRDLWQKVRDVLEQALELAPEKRSRFLDVACSSDQTFRSVVVCCSKTRSRFTDLEIKTTGWVSDAGWTPDATALSSLQTEDNATVSLWIQGLSGGPPERLMHFDSEPSRIIAYAWSQDGKKIAITRAVRYDTDVVQFSGFVSGCCY
jgi:hypothetical protein